MPGAWAHMTLFLGSPLHVVVPTFVNHTVSDYLLFQIPSKGAGMVYPSLHHLHSEQVIGQRKYLVNMCWLAEQDERLFLAFPHTKVRTMSLFPSLSLLLLSVVTASCSETESCENVQKTCPVITCGSPGINGFPGKDGHDGAKGEKGEPGTIGLFYLCDILPSRQNCLGI